MAHRRSKYPTMTSPRCLHAVYSILRSPCAANSRLTSSSGTSGATFCTKSVREGVSTGARSASEATLGSAKPPAAPAVLAPLLRPSRCSVGSAGSCPSSSPPTELKTSSSMLAVLPTLRRRGLPATVRVFIAASLTGAAAGSSAAAAVLLCADGCCSPSPSRSGSNLQIYHT